MDPSKNKAQLTATATVQVGLSSFGVVALVFRFDVPL
jgi:hypothetical protein